VKEAVRGRNPSINPRLGSSKAERVLGTHETAERYRPFAPFLRLKPQQTGTRLLPGHGELQLPRGAPFLDTEP